MFELDPLHHVALTVTDMTRADWFYGEVLGLQKVARPPFDFDPRDAHVALRVASYEDTLTRLKSFGLDVLELPDNLTPWAQIYVTDPDGNVVEFNVERGNLRRPA